jgi:RNA polymerase sigma-70 factor (ECF subfamily)
LLKIRVSLCEGVIRLNANYLTATATIGYSGAWTPAMEKTTAIHTLPAAARDERAFEQIFKKYFKDLHAYACSMVKEKGVAEGIVQNVFLKIWERADTLNYQQATAPYLYRAVHNESINHLKHKKVRQAYDAYALKQQVYEKSSATSKVQLSELQQKISLALNDLPQQCRIIFQMSRFRDMKYQEIANELGISVKTVEAQMGKALKVLRKKLADYLPILLFTILQ